LEPNFKALGSQLLIDVNFLVFLAATYARRTNHTPENPTYPQQNDEN